jgi:signal transduction histidine kinase
MKKNLVVNGGFILALAILASIVFLSHWYMTQWAISDQREEYTFSVIQKLDKLLYALRDASRSQRGFSRTGSGEYLEAFREALGNVEQDMATLKSLANGHPWLERRLAEIEPLVREKLDERRGSIQIGQGEVSPAVAGRVRVATDEIRRRVAAAQDEAMRVLREASARQDADVGKMQRLLLANSFIIFVLFSMVFLLSKRDIARRVRSEQELISHRNQLDSLVKVRTMELENANQELQVEIAERKRMEEALQQIHHRLSDHQNAIQEQERLVLAREVHDEIGQNLTALKLDLTWIEHRFPPGNGELAARFREMRTSLDQLLVKAQHITAELRPPLLDNLGLAAAIEWQAGEFMRRSGIECHLMLNEGVEVANQHTAMAIMRIFQEALTNIIRHARATEVGISLCERDGMIILEISDDGCGISVEETDSPTAYGIMGMRERAELCRGELKITGKPEEGTTISLIIPHSPDEEDL